MATYRFEKVYEKAWFTEVEADSFEEAKRIVNEGDCDWDEDDGGESYLTNSYAQLVDEDGCCEEDYEWTPGDE